MPTLLNKQNRQNRQHDAFARATIPETPLREGESEHSLMSVSFLEYSSIDELKKNLAVIGVDRSYIDTFARKLIFKTILIKNIDNRAANILKQEMLSLGADAAVAHDVASFKKGKSSVIAGATEKQFNQLIKKLALQPYDLKMLAIRLQSFITGCVSHIINCRQKTITITAKPIIMGVLNITPDSFYDGGHYMSRDKALDHAFTMINEGADIIDIGGESSRPGSQYIEETEEKKRILWIVEKLSKKGICVSVDTRRFSVAVAALKAGASIINDISALRDSPDMATIIKKYNALVIIMHMQGIPRTMQHTPYYTDVVGEVFDFFKERLVYARRCGIPAENIVLDPGIGFGKTLTHNMELIKNIKTLSTLGYPIMIGVSRKSLIEHHVCASTGISVPPDARLPGSIALSVLAYQQGIRIFRTHDVAQTKQALLLAQAMTSCSSAKIHNKNRIGIWN